MPNAFVVQIESATPGVALEGLYLGEPDSGYVLFWGGRMHFEAPDHFRYEPYPAPQPGALTTEIALHHLHGGPLCIPLPIRLRRPNALKMGDAILVTLKRAADGAPLHTKTLRISTTDVYPYSRSDIPRRDSNGQLVTYAFPASMDLTLNESETTFPVIGGAPVQLPEDAHLDYLTAFAFIEVVNREAQRLLDIVDFQAAWPRWLSPAEAMQPVRCMVTGYMLMPTFSTQGLQETARDHDAELLELDQQCALWAALGFNGGMLQDWAKKEKPLSAAEVNAVADGWGVTGRLMAKSDPLDASGVGIAHVDLVSGLPAVYQGLRNTDWLAGSFERQGRLLDWVRATRQDYVDDYASPMEPPDRRLRMAIGDEEGMRLSSLDCLAFADQAAAQAHLRQDLLDYLTAQGLDVAEFRAAWLNYLSGVNPDPAYFGAATWADLTPPAAATHNPMNTPSATPAMARLWVWTLLFLHQQMSDGFARVTQVLSAGLAGPGQPARALTTYSNYNAPFHCTFLQESGDYDSIMPDAFLDARVNRRLRALGPARHAPHIEDWNYVGAYLNISSAAADMVRSAATLGGDSRDCSVYICPNAGHMVNPDEFLYRTLSYAMRGVAAIDYFSWAPWPQQYDGWSWHIMAYGQIQEATRMLARAEAALGETRPERASVAILITRGSDYLCSNDAEYPLFAMERFNLHRALTHAGLAVDFLDEIALVEGGLADYRVLYVCDPVLMSRPAADNPGADAHAALERWVRSGGRLVLSPGAAVMDESGAPLAFMDAMTGLEPRSDFALRDGDGILRRPVTAQSDVQGSNFSADASRGIEVHLRNDAGDRLVRADDSPATLIAPTTQGHGALSYLDHAPLVPLPGGTAEVLAEYLAADPPQTPLGIAMTRHGVGLGQVYCYGFFVGAQYLHEAQGAVWHHPPTGGSVSLHAMPGGWSRSIRGWAERAVREAGITPAVTLWDATGRHTLDRAIEIRVSASKDGAAIGLFNWSGIEVAADRTYVKPANLLLRFWLQKDSRAQVRAASARSGADLPISVGRRFKIPVTGLEMYEITIALSAFTTVDIVTVRVSPGRRLKSATPRFSGPLRRLDGGDSGGGGLYVAPSGRVIRTPPRVEKRLQHFQAARHRSR